MTMVIAATPDPPYTAVIFTSLHATDDATGLEGYDAAAARMDDLAACQPGYLGVESARGALGITVSYWASPAHARAWKAVAEHAAVQRIGAERWYAHYRVRIATVERDYSGGRKSEEFGGR
jgi:heme-degrading monooxygenase HmoA